MPSLSFWTTFYAMMSSDSRIVWTLLILLQLENNANSPGPHVRDAHAAETSRDGYMRTPTVRVDPPPATLQYSRDQLLSVPPSGLDATALSNIRQLGIRSGIVYRKPAPIEPGDGNRMRSVPSSTAGLTLCLPRVRLPSLTAFSLTFNLPTLLVFVLLCSTPSLSALPRNALRSPLSSLTLESTYFSSRKHGSTTGATKPRSPSSLPAAIQHVRFPAAPAVVASLSFSETHFPLI